MHITHDLSVPIDGILEVKQHLAGEIYKADIPRSNYFSEHYQGEIFLEFESMQHTGSFKIRGVSNKLCGLTTVEKRRGMVACSAGNHAQGVSPSYVMLDIDGKVMMPKGVPKSRVVAIYDYSAEVVLHGSNFSDTLTEASDIVEPEGRIFTPPYDDPQVIAGQGAIGLEVLEDLYDVDSVIAPVNGGGLTAGIATVIKSINPTIHIINAQSGNVRDTTVSWHAEEITSHRHAGALTGGCDVTRPGKLTYEIARQLVDDIILISEDDIHQSMAALIQCNKAITEGAGALACAALLSGRLDSYIQSRETVSPISGDNVDLSWVSQVTGFVDA